MGNGGNECADVIAKKTQDMNQPSNDLTEDPNTITKRKISNQRFVKPTIPELNCPSNLSSAVAKLRNGYLKEHFKRSRTICLKAQWYVAGPTQPLRAINVLSGIAKRASPYRSPLFRHSQVEKERKNFPGYFSALCRQWIEPLSTYKKDF
ncbi:hypothetical protein TNCV_263151 [Trichonephila clavipes]|nr:hypothetical protein TNCV_263151 [Trichonephila clavipes]